ncbi:MAG: glycerophosphodiester phosphodiesterase [Oenococcus sp.]|uniref:glycerophosphodiester phosphodiesterase family protein n=1 Tax=Oenococcus sp. TaxID=1979414 RepID=UPI0039ED1C31
MPFRQAHKRKMSSSMDMTIIVILVFLLAFNWLANFLFQLANQLMPQIDHILSWPLSSWLNLFLGLACYILIWLAFVWSIQLFFFYFLTIKHRDTRWSGVRLRYFHPGLHMMCLWLLLAALPLANIGYKLPLATLIKLPDFIIQPFAGNIFLIAAILLGLICFWLFTIKFLQVIPAVMSGQSFFQALRYSWKEMPTKKILHLCLMLFINVIVLSVITGIVFAAQTLVDHLAFLSARLFANGLMTLFTAILYAATYELLKSIFRQSFPVENHFLYQKRCSRISFQQAAAAVLATVAVGAASCLLADNFFPRLDRIPLVISHKGSNGNNGVPNSLQSLVSTVHVKPDYIELDVHYTKDHQFVVVHDDNLKTLTGHKLQAEHVTLKRLKSLTIAYRGHKAKMVSLREYMNRAQDHQQKLLVEIKTPPMVQQSSTLTKTFLRQYGSALLRHGDLLHSLNQNVMRQIHTKQPRLKVGFIVSYNTESLPGGDNNFYTTEYSTLNNVLVKKIHRQHKRIFAWTANDRQAMHWLSVMNVDSIITDYPQRLKNILAAPRRLSYNQALLRYMLTIRQVY